MINCNLSLWPGYGVKFRRESEGCGNLGISRQHSLNRSNSMAAGSTHCYPSPCSTQLDRMSGTGGQDWQSCYKWARDVVALPFFLPNPYEPHVLTSRHVDIRYWVHYFAGLQMDLVHIIKKLCPWRAHYFLLIPQCNASNFVVWLYSQWWHIMVESQVSKTGVNYSLSLYGVRIKWTRVISDTAMLVASTSPFGALW